MRFCIPYFIFSCHLPRRTLNAQVGRIDDEREVYANYVYVSEISTQIGRSDLISKANASMEIVNRAGWNRESPLEGSAMKQE